MKTIKAEPAKKQTKATSRAVKVVDKRPGYAAVRERDRQRDPVSVERKSEDELLNKIQRLMLVSSQREDYRNTTISPASALQYQVNVIGTTGGKLTVLDADGKINENATRIFHDWAKHAEMTRGTHLNELLQVLLVQLSHVGGDFIAVLDADGELTSAANPTRRLKIFESDQVKCINDTAFAKLYDTNRYHQSHGIVKDYLDRVCGAFVGSRRDSDFFGQDEFIHLKLETPGDFSTANWIQFGNFERPNQARGISPVTHLSNTIGDLATLEASELSAAKLNSAFGLIISDIDADKAEEQASRAYSVAHDDAIAEGKTEEEAVEIATAYAKNARAAADRLMEGQSAILTAQPNKRIESFKTDRPNLNVIELYDRLKAECGTVLGLPQMYMNLKPQGSYSASRAEMVLFRPVVRRWQKAFERDFLDWLASRVLVSYGINVDGLGFKWAWPDFEEVDEGSMQTALTKQFANCEKNLMDIHGANTEKFIDRRAVETQMFHDKGLLAPWEVSMSGTQLMPAEPTENIDAYDAEKVEEEGKEEA